MIEIPLAPESDYTAVDVRLDGTVFTLGLDWNERAGLWYLSIGIPAASGTLTLVSGVPMVCNVPLTLGLVDPSWVGGLLVVLGDKDPGHGDWGTHARLWYLTREEFNA